MTANPYHITGPALISFSGGRTSAFMLRQILDAHDGQLPPDVHVCFANTGKEREETLRFVHECATRWGVKVRWLEWRARSGELEDRFAEVGFNSADREGRWFAELIRQKQYLPNPIMRFCTTELKIRVMKQFMLCQDYERWHNIIGLRDDEMIRVFKMYARNKQKRERWTSLAPMADAGHRLEDVQAFWQVQDFDLQLRPHEGNCDLCYLKGRDKRAAIIRADPASADWWIEQEESVDRNTKPAPLGPYRRAVFDLPYWDADKDDYVSDFLGWQVDWTPFEKRQARARFRKDESYTQLREAVLTSPLLPMEELAEDWDHDAECGLICAGDA